MRLKSKERHSVDGCPQKDSTGTIAFDTQLHLELAIPYRTTCYHLVSCQLSQSFSSMPRNRAEADDAWVFGSTRHAMPNLNPPTGCHRLPATTRWGRPLRPQGDLQRQDGQHSLAMAVSVGRACNTHHHALMRKRREAEASRPTGINEKGASALTASADERCGRQCTHSIGKRHAGKKVAEPQLARNVPSTERGLVYGRRFRKPHLS